jgi:indolepyruvate ferredoxin oxidoreductase beta subunit
MGERRPGETPDSSARPTNVLVVGVGGQGVLMISNILAQVCARQGFEVKQSEVHGMAKRGGVVFSHVRFGPRVWSPTIPKGEADVVVALEWAEGLRWLPYLHPERGIFLADTRRIVPPFACRDRRPGARTTYPSAVPAAIQERLPQSIVLDALGVAEELGNPRVANSVLLGALSTVFEFPLEEWLSVVDSSVPPSTREVNRAAFERGREWEKSAGGFDGAGDATASESEIPSPSPGVHLEIIEAWCKGCDICVKVCPERCLVLNADQVAELTDPGACTGCRVCEWLCPDFAIRVHNGPIPKEAGS